MYTLLDVVGTAEKLAEQAALADRMKYKKFVEEAEKFAAAENLIVAGPSATRLLLGDPDDRTLPPKLGLDSFQYEFYSANILAQARGLGDALFKLDPNGLGHYVTVTTKVPGRVMAVSVDGRDMFTLIALQVDKVKTADVVIPSLRPAQFASDESGALKLACAGPEIQLIEIYAALCDPAKASEWGDILQAEAAMRALFEKEIKGKIANALDSATGGAPENKTKFTKLLLEKFAAGPGRLIVGPVAIAALAGRNPAGRLQVVTAENFDEEARVLEALAAQAGVKIVCKVDNPGIPADYRLRRMTVHVLRSGPVADIYNSAAYELVPFTRVPGLAAKVGTPFVLQRFRLVDIWTMQVLLKMEALEVDAARVIIRGMIAGFSEASQLVAEALTKKSASKLFPLQDYIGRVEDATRMLKRASRGKFYPPYYPAKGSG